VRFFHLAEAATLATSWRCSGVSWSARALPPFLPPARPLTRSGCLLPSLTVSSASPMAMSNTCLASWIGSRGLLATIRVCHSSAVILKLRHYPDSRPLAKSKLAEVKKRKKLLRAGSGGASAKAPVTVEAQSAPPSSSRLPIVRPSEDKRSCRAMAGERENVGVQKVEEKDNRKPGPN
jgi:hypothetical protein